MDLSRTAYGYQPHREDDTALRARLRELAGQRKRFGSPRLHIMLKRENLVVNHKRTERIYREEGLALRRKRRRKGAAGARMVIPAPERPNQKWSMDFITDSIVTGRRFRALAIVDDYSRECPAIEVDTSMGGARVVSVLERLADIRGLPEVITVDNGPEFAGRASLLVEPWMNGLTGKVSSSVLFVLASLLRTPSLKASMAGCAMNA